MRFGNLDNNKITEFVRVANSAPRKPRADRGTTRTPRPPASIKIPRMPRETCYVCGRFLPADRSPRGIPGAPCIIEYVEPVGRVV